MALDLSKETPRSPFADLGGIPWLPRMIDKARAFAAGTMGDYTPYPCPADQRFLGFMGIDANQFLDVIKSGADDEALRAWVAERAQNKTAADYAGYRASLFTPITDEPMLGYLNGAKEGLKAERPDANLDGIDNFSKLICVEEGHPIPQA